jgi:hypothetical protein
MLKEVAKSNATIDLADRISPSKTPSLGVLRYSLCVLVSFAALVFALGFAIEFRNLVRIAMTGEFFPQIGI